MNLDNLNLENETMNLELAHITPDKVHDILRQHMLVDGFDFVLDLLNSKGSYLIDQLTGESYLDFFTFFASNPIGMNHPKMFDDKIKKDLLTAGINKPSNSDIYTTLMAEFVETFARVAKPSFMKYLFFVSGGTLAVENGLKVAFDWKVQKNFRKGYTEEKGHKVLHFKQAFHGRSGYTLSLTNTEPNKVKYFPKFDWPRISNPKIVFPLADNLDNILNSEDKAIEEIYDAIYKNKDDIAVLILEPIQAEGGDNFFRQEFHQRLREICDENEILLMYDEVQTGFGITGKFWASEYYVKPDIIAFGKKAQVCGIMVTDRIDDIEEHCFKKSSRINSTWGSDLVDMVRGKYILEIIEEEELVENAKLLGSYLLENLNSLQKEFPGVINNSRGLGLMCSFDFNTPEERNEFKQKCYEEKLLILGCGEKSIRFRPALNITKEDLDKGLKVIHNIIFLMSSKN